MARNSARTCPQCRQYVAVVAHYPPRPDRELAISGFQLRRSMAKQSNYFLDELDRLEHDLKTRVNELRNVIAGNCRCGTPLEEGNLCALCGVLEGKTPSRPTNKANSF